MRLLILGAGISGRAAARLGRRSGYEVTVYDRLPGPALSLLGEGFSVVSGDWSFDLLEGMDAVVASPGVPEHARPISDTLEASVELWSEIEFAARHTDVPMLVVTGTNGKTTVATVAAEMLTRGGMKVAAAGNIGVALSDVIGEPWDMLVVEASSFQLRFIDSFRPDIAVLLNVAADHLDWHGSVPAYRAAKARLCENQSPEDLIVYDADDPGASSIASGAAARQLPVSGARHPPEGAGVSGGMLRVGGAEIDVATLTVSDAAYLLDLVAAGAAASEAGAPADAISEVISAFRPGPHRRETVGTWDGVDWVDDSKATNPHAALASIEAFTAVVLIAGGRNKGLELDEMVRHPHVRNVIALGEAALELAEGSSGRVDVVTTMIEAVQIADQRANEGDTVLLAPGCASFDMFSDYADRGEAFATAVLDRKDR